MKTLTVVLRSMALLLAALAVSDGTAFAQQSQGTDTRVGCIDRSHGVAQFVDTTHRSRGQIAADIGSSVSGGNSLIDPCVAGLTSGVPASEYAALASKAPGAYQPLPAASPSASSSGVSNSVLANSTVAQPAAIPANAPAFPFRFNYQNLDLLAPPNLLPFFDERGVTDDGRVFGALYDENANPYVSVYQGNALKLLVAGYPTYVSKFGVVGGWVTTDPVNGYSQAAIFRGNNVQLIPRAPNEVTSQVFVINDFGTAAVGSYDVNGVGTLYVYQNGRLKKANVNNIGVAIAIAAINDSGILVGYEQLANGNFIGFRYDINSSKTTFLPPLPTEPNSWALGINDWGDVVGYSFVSFGLERIGIWAANGKFDTYFVEGTASIPTVSNYLYINDARLIVITRTTDNQSYLVPQKGVRLTLQSLINYDASVNGPPSAVWGLNNFGWIIGSSFNDFLLTPTFGK